MMVRDIFADPVEVEADLALLESMTWMRKEFAERLCGACREPNEAMLATLRSEPAYQLSEFLYLLRARGIDSVDAVRRLAELHNDYMANLLRDPQKMRRIGITKERLLDSMFTADTMPRLLQNWRDRPGSIDQSNLARLLASIMSSETCRKLVVVLSTAEFLERAKTPYGTVVISSNGFLERLFGECLRELRMRIERV
jgi:hypothetical protein